MSQPVAPAVTGLLALQKRKAFLIVIHPELKRATQLLPLTPAETGCIVGNVSQLSVKFRNLFSLPQA